MATKEEEREAGYRSPYQAQLDALVHQINNRKPVHSNLNGDAFYRQYEDKFARQGALERMDTEGQLKGLTGGHNNSYARQAGQRVQQEQEQQLGAVIPELYQLAMDNYNQQGKELVDRYEQLVELDDKAYEEYLQQDPVGDFVKQNKHLLDLKDHAGGYYDYAVRDALAKADLTDGQRTELENYYGITLRDYANQKVEEAVAFDTMLGTGGYGVTDYADAASKLRQMGASQEIQQQLLTEDAWNKLRTEAEKAAEDGEGTINLVTVFDSYTEYLRFFVSTAEKTGKKES